jgi:hypothetical protein
MYGPCVDRESTATMTPPSKTNDSVVVPLANFIRCSLSASPVYTLKCLLQNAAGCDSTQNMRSKRPLPRSTSATSPNAPHSLSGTHATPLWVRAFAPTLAADSGTPKRGSRKRLHSRLQSGEEKRPRSVWHPRSEPEP